MFKENFIPQKNSESENPAVYPEQNKPLFFNILPIEPIMGNIKICFTDSDREGAHRFGISMLPASSQRKFVTDGIKADFVYTTFEDVEGGKPIEIDLQKHDSILRVYQTKLIRDQFQGIADVIKTNFLNDLQLWFDDKNHYHTQYKEFKNYGLRVQVDSHTKTPELLISWDGVSRVSSYSLRELYTRPGFDVNLIKGFLFRNQFFTEKNKPESTRFHPEEVYPVLNAGLMRFMGISLSNSPDKIRHKRYYNEVSWFFQKFINTEAFKQIIPHKGKFKPVQENQRFSITHNKNLLEFGEGNTEYDPYRGLKSNGPASPPELDQMQYFFIAGNRDEDTLMRLNEYLKSDSNLYGSLNNYLKTPYRENEQLKILFDPDDHPLDFILNKIKLLPLQSGTGYYAFFISPWSEWESNLHKWVIHPLLKEALLRRGIMMQTIYRNKILKEGLQYFIPNLASSMIGKLGGVPWRLNRKVYNQELIVGFGAFRSNKNNVRYVGASFCFSNDGTFQKMDCFRADQLYAIAGSLREALFSYREQHREVKRIVIHFYKKLSKKEMYPIDKMLRDLCMDVPVVVVSVNKTYSKDIVTFAGKDDSTLPLSGSYIRYGHHKYLLYINDRFSWNVQSLKCMPLPIKISLAANKEGYLDEPGVVNGLMQQVYDFCFMYWRSVRHSSLPVTVVYPEMLARIFPWFRDGVLPEIGERRLFML